MPVDWRRNGCKRGFLARKRFGCPVVDLRFDAAQVIRSEFPAGSRLQDAPAWSRND